MVVIKDVTENWVLGMTLKRQIWIGIGLIGAALSGCATRQLVATPLSESRVSVTSYAAMSYPPLALNDAKTIDFDASTSPVARFPDGLGVYASFALGQQPTPTVLRVRTWFSSIWLRHATVLKPYVMFLDADKHVISNVESFGGADGATLVQGSYRQGYFLVPPNARFFILYSASSESDRMVLTAQSGKRWGVTNAYSGTVEVKREFSHRVVLPGRDQFDSAFRFSPKSGENYEVTVHPGTPLKVDVYHIDSHDGHYSVEPVSDLEIIRRCS
jgi:hypothetical protein